MKLSPAIEYARVEVRIDGVTYVHELEPTHMRITGTVEVQTEAREVRLDEVDDPKPWYERVPDERTANINLSGPLARMTAHKGGRAPESDDTPTCTVCRQDQGKDCAHFVAR